eukprot:6188266-Pleurochrysis_carterae.AAC.1
MAYNSPLVPATVANLLRAVGLGYLPLDLKNSVLPVRRLDIGVSPGAFLTPPRPTLIELNLPVLYKSACSSDRYPRPGRGPPLSGLTHASLWGDWDRCRSLRATAPAPSHRPSAAAASVSSPCPSIRPWRKLGVVGGGPDVTPA